MQSVSFIAGDVGKEKIFFLYPGYENAHSHLSVYAHQRAAKFDTPVRHNASNVFQVTTFNETVKMARATVSRDLVYIQGTDYPGEYVTARDF